MKHMMSIMILFAILTTGCGEEPQANQPAAQPTRPASDTYTVRGVILQLPDPANPASELRIKHEAVADLKNISGQVVGMASMAMPFPIAEGVSLDGYAVDDIIEFNFEVIWRPDPSWRLTSISKLPADTVLVFE
jgi:hypothetical protein